ncbi:WSC-domain-containing protein [Artomyces pyxidatus]|uniref:WSC-domain-containing protein n=1 Tax=Artomyces pyxidatus TaxID=48021 RepID=A0ACB8STA7_9AGAM|nr:WSC-domain-containing protein [Artomyces pyxidatus]
MQSSALTLLLLSSVHGALAGSGVITTRQTLPTSFPGNWTVEGCFTDTASARTLSGATYASDDAMTIESCMAFCSTSSFLYAGVEYGKQCYCDYAVQDPGTLTNLTECDFPCSGNSSEVCGAANRMNIFFSGDVDAIPVVLSPITLGSDNWITLGCFTDNVNARTFPHLAPTTFLGESTAEEVLCAEYCDIQGYYYAGLEYGDECWCGNDLGNSTQAPLGDCHMVCQGDYYHGEFCGGRERLTVYQKDICASNSVSNFWLDAFYKTEPSTGPLGYYLVLSEADEAGYAILTTNPCENCCGVGIELELQSGSLTTAGSPAYGTVLVNEGESPTFLQNYSYPPQIYCTTASSQSITTLAVNDRTDEWSICTNNSADGRLDVVFAPVANHPHYSLSECSPVFMLLLDSPFDC